MALQAFMQVLQGIIRNDQGFVGLYKVSSRLQDGASFTFCRIV